MSDTLDNHADLSLVFDEFLAQRQQGKSPILDEYCQRFPDLAEQLRLHVSLYDALGDAGGVTENHGARPEVDPSSASGTTASKADDDEIKRALPSPEDYGIQRMLEAETFLVESQSESNDPSLEHEERYHRLRLHATGGIGRVWLAHDSDLGRDIALKELRPEHAQNAMFQARFVREARITGQLEHPAIMPVYSLVRARDGQQPFYTMRFVKGRTLSAAARAYHHRRLAGRADSLELPTLLNAFVTVCNAVAYIHSLQTVGSYRQESTATGVHACGGCDDPGKPRQEPF